MTPQREAHEHYQRHQSLRRLAHRGNARRRPHRGDRRRATLHRNDRRGRRRPGRAACDLRPDRRARRAPASRCTSSRSTIRRREKRQRGRTDGSFAASLAARDATADMSVGTVFHPEGLDGVMIVGSDFVMVTARAGAVTVIPLAQVAWVSAGAHDDRRGAARAFRGAGRRLGRGYRGSPAGSEDHEAVRSRRSRLDGLRAHDRRQRHLFVATVLPRGSWGPGVVADRARECRMAAVGTALQLGRPLPRGRLPGRCGARSCVREYDRAGCVVAGRDRRWVGHCRRPHAGRGSRSTPGRASSSRRFTGTRRLPLWWAWRTPVSASS